MSRGPTESYSRGNRQSSSKLEGKFGIAFSENPRISGMSLKYDGDDHSSYEISSTGGIKRGRLNGGNDPRCDADVARDAARLLKDPNFVKETMKGFEKSRCHLKENDIRAFGRTLERHYRETGGGDVLTSKLMS